MSTGPNWAIEENIAVARKAKAPGVSAEMDYVDFPPMPDRRAPMNVSSNSEENATEIVVGDVLGGFGLQPTGDFPIKNQVAFKEMANGRPFGPRRCGILPPPNRQTHREITTDSHAQSTEISAYAI